MERYLGDEPIDTSELAKALAAGIASATVFPVLCGSATKLVGVDRLAKFLVDEAPAPRAADGAAGALVFKTIVDPYVGHVNLFKVLQGTVKHDDVLMNGRTKADERLHQLFVMRGKDQDTVTDVPAGDIAAVAKLANTGTGDVLAAKGTTLDVDVLEPPEPLLAVAIHAKSKADEDKLANALHRLQEEDPVLRIERNAETHQTVLRGMGETHLSIATEKLHRKFGVEIETDEVRVAYRETISGTAEAEGRSRSRAEVTGSSRSRGCASSRSQRGEGNEFVDAIVGGVIPRNFIPAVEKGVADTEEHGGALGFPVVDVKVTCFDGKHHPVDSSEMAFKTAASIGLRDALAQGEPGAARTGERARRHGARGEPGRHHGRPQRQAGPHPGFGVGWRRRGRDRRERADVGGAALRDRPAVDDRWTGPLHAPPLALRPGACASRRQGGGGGTGEPARVAIGILVM